MLINMLSFEWRYFTRQPSFIVTMLIFFLLPFLSVVLDNLQIGSGGNVNFNSPYSIALTILTLGFFAMFLVVNFVANTAMRNDEVHMSEILYTKPIKPASYQLGRFLGAYFVVVTVAAMVPLGLFLGSIMPGVDPERLGPTHLLAYVTPFLIFSVPTLFVLSAIFYAAALRFRGMMAVYLFALGIFVLYGAVGAIFNEPSQRDIMAISDPFGIRAFLSVTQYWTPSERNAQVLMLTGNVLYNRLLWIGIGLVVLLGLGRIFAPLSLPKKKLKKIKAGLSIGMPINNSITASYTKGADFRQFIARVLFEIKQVVMSPAFIILLLIGAVLVVSEFIDPAGIYGAANWPLTQYMVELIQNGFSLSLIIVITYYTAEVVWRERSTGIGDIVDSMPVHNFTFWFSKLIAVCTVIIALLLVGMLATMANQLSKGYLNFDLSQYVISLLYFTALPFILLTVLAFFIQALSPNKYVGMLIFVAYFFVSLVFSELGLEHNMFQFSAAPIMQYSDMNGYGWALTTQHYYMLYWAAFALVLAAFSFAMWQRGPDTNLKHRISQLGYSLGRSGQTIVIVGIVGFISVATVIHYNTRVINQFVVQDDLIDTRVAYENTYSQYENDPVPTVTAVDINVAIFPSIRKLEAVAVLSFENKTDQTINKFLINYPEYSTVEIQGAKIEDFNSEFKTAWMSFEQSLAPGDKVDATIKVTRQHQGFKDRGEDSNLVKNGTFINNFALLPNLGVNQGYYLNDQHERRKNDLPPPKRAYKLEDESRYNESFFGSHIGLIDFKATLSTSEDQIAIAPGYLEKYWTEGGRNYFVYQMDTPMINFYNIMSGDLEVKSEMHNGVNIAVYYHKEHAWNVDRMIESSKDSLDLFSEQFGPYQHKQLRIIEFPGYSSFAQSFANTVPYSERIGFITDLRDTSEIDPVYYITAHEVAHQWFGHQLDAANVQGSAILSEALSQYASLQVMQNEYGPAKMRKFLTYELDSYLRGRATEYLEEMPFMRSENQQYMHYRKGSVVMMAIADRIGFEQLNAALKSLIEQFRFSQDRLATTLDLLAAIKAVSAPEHHAFIDQQFEQITIYNLRIDDVVVNETEGEPKTLEIAINTEQFIADGKGNEQPQSFSDLVDIVVFSGDPNDLDADAQVLYQHKHLLQDGESTITLDYSQIDTSKGEPAYIGLDPFVRYIDRNNMDNIFKL
jgi:ABC-2 type transport system permease protein